jgi:hypothetical protein
MLETISVQMTVRSTRGNKSKTIDKPATDLLPIAATDEADHNLTAANAEPLSPTSPPAKVPRIEQFNGKGTTPLKKAAPVSAAIQAIAVNLLALRASVPEVPLADLPGFVGRTVNVYGDIVSVGDVNPNLTVVVIADRDCTRTLWCHDQAFRAHFKSIDTSKPVLAKLMNVRVSNSTSLNWGSEPPADQPHDVIYSDGVWGTPPTGFGPLALPMVKVDSITDQFVFRNVGPVSANFLSAVVSSIPIGVACSCEAVHDISCFGQLRPGHNLQTMHYALKVTAFFDRASPLFSVPLSPELSASLLEPSLGQIEDVLDALQSSDGKRAQEVMKAIDDCLRDLSSSKWSIYCSGGGSAKGGGYYPRVHRMFKIDI